MVNIYLAVILLHLEIVVESRLALALGIIYESSRGSYDDSFEDQIIGRTRRQPVPHNIYIHNPNLNQPNHPFYFGGTQ